MCFTSYIIDVDQSANNLKLKLRTDFYKISNSYYKLDNINVI